MKEKYVFIGNRFQALEEMVRLGLQVQIIPIDSKLKLIEDITNTNFDVLVSNGCPYILPVSAIIKGHQKYINLHPSLLPDLKGTNPIREAIAQNKPMGATCHYMIDEVDSGAVISQVRIDPNREDLNDCYRQAFKAEAQAFREAYKRNFEPL